MIPASTSLPPEFVFDNKPTGKTEFEIIKEMYPFLDDEEIRKSLGQVSVVINEGTEKIKEDWEKSMTAMQELQQQVIDGLSSGIGDAFASAIVDGENFGQSMINVFKSIMKQIIATIVQQQVLNSLMGTTTGGSGNIISNLLGSIIPANDIAFGPSAGRYITGPEGTFSLNPNDSIVAGTNLFGGGQGSKNMTVNGYIDGSSIFLSNTRQTNTVNRLS